MVQKSTEDFFLFGVAHSPYAFGPEFQAQSFELIQRLFDLHRIVGQQFCRRIDGGQPATDHDRRQADLQVGQ